MSSATVQGLHRGSPVRAGERGRLVVAKQVVEKIAAQAAFEITGVGEHRGAFAASPGLARGPRPTVNVQLDGSEAWLSVEVGMTYPAPLRAATDELRSHLVRRVEQLSGITVRRLDIRIGWLGAAAEQPRKLA